LKGDFDDQRWVYRRGTRGPCSILWTGQTEDDFGLLWDGLTLVSSQWMLEFNALFQLGLVIASGGEALVLVNRGAQSSHCKHCQEKNHCEEDWFNGIHAMLFEIHHQGVSSVSGGVWQIH